MGVRSRSVAGRTNAAAAGARAAALGLMQQCDLMNHDGEMETVPEGVNKDDEIGHVRPLPLMKFRGFAAMRMGQKRQELQKQLDEVDQEYETCLRARRAVSAALPVLQRPNSIQPCILSNELTRRDNHWLENLKNRGGPTQNYKVIHGPIILGTSEDTADISVDPSSCVCAVLATRQDFSMGGEGDGQRAFLLMCNRTEGVSFREKAQSLPLELCQVVINHDKDLPTVFFTVPFPAHPTHRLAGRTLRFCSLHPLEMAHSELDSFYNEIVRARELNRQLDCRTQGKIVSGAMYCVASFPGEERDLWGWLIYAPVMEIVQAFGGEASLACVWTTAETTEDGSSPATWM